jgi:hypothetical protein
MTHGAYVKLFMSFLYFTDKEVIMFENIIKYLIFVMHLKSIFLKGTNCIFESYLGKFVNWSIW